MISGGEAVKVMTYRLSVAHLEEPLFSAVDAAGMVDQGFQFEVYRPEVPHFVLLPPYRLPVTSDTSGWLVVQEIFVPLPKIEPADPQRAIAEQPPSDEDRRQNSATRGSGHAKDSSAPFLLP